MAEMQALLQQALTLDPAKRIEMADALLESVDEEGSGLQTDDEVAAEVERRRQDIRDGKVVLIPWEEARDRLRQEFPDPTGA